MTDTRTTSSKASEIICSIHWLSFTVHEPEKKAFRLYSLLFEKIFGELESQGHGGRGFKEIYKGAIGIKLYASPIRPDEDYFHFEFPGVACEAIPFYIFQALIAYLEENYPNSYKFKRLDMAFDHVPFEPQLVEAALLENKARTLAKRESIKVFGSPLQLRDNGELGTYTVQLGANESERMITVYNKRGHTRFEFQTRDKRADAVAKELLSSEVENWYSIMLSHLLDFIQFDTDWWKAFVETQGRANKKVTTVKEVTTEKVVNWLDNQVSAALSAVNDAFSKEFLGKLIDRGRKKRGNRYKPLFDTDDEPKLGND